jgi:tetratricopeptide (TPR) repeat protein
MSHAVRLAVLLAMPAACLPASALAQKQALASTTALRQWAQAVTDHTPGEPDAAVGYVAALTYRARVDLNTSFSLFIAALQENFIVTRSDTDADVTAIAREIRGKTGTAAFLKRAAVLHTDALVFAGRFPRVRDDAPPPPPSSDRERRPAAIPLLYNELISLSRDGEVLGEARADWNLPFARSLLDVLLHADRGHVPREDLSFVSAWYHAVSAFLFANNNYADSTAHLQHAARVLPDDPHALFDRASYAETLGLPIYQVLLDPAGSGNRAYEAVGIPSGDKTNGEAERLYRRTIAVDPSYVEARVRLARLLERRGRHEEAAEQITRALDARPTGVPLFFAHLVAGRIASARGRYEDALRHYRAASAVDVNAQSALLGASHAALMLSDVPEALGPLQRLDPAPAAGDEDPWLDYERGAGRDVKALLEALWAQFAARQ